MTVQIAKYISQISEEGRRLQKPKCYDFSNQGELVYPKRSNYNNGETCRRPGVKATEIWWLSQPRWACLSEQQRI